MWSARSFARTAIVRRGGRCGYGLSDAYAAAGAFARSEGALPAAGRQQRRQRARPRLERYTTGACPVRGHRRRPDRPVGRSAPLPRGWRRRTHRVRSVGARADEVAPGLAIEAPIRTELPTEDPAPFTDYGAEAIDVTVGGGNVDLAAIVRVSTGFTIWWRTRGSRTSPLPTSPSTPGSASASTGSNGWARLWPE